MVALPPGVGCWRCLLRWALLVAAVGLLMGACWASTACVVGALCGGFCGACGRFAGRGRILGRGGGAGGCMGVLHRFSDGWALVVLRGDGGGVAPELLRGAVTASGAVPWLPGAVQLRGGRDGLVRRFLRWVGPCVAGRLLAALAGALVGAGTGRGAGRLMGYAGSRGPPGSPGGHKKPGRYAPALCLIGTLQKCLCAVRQCSMSLSRSSSSMRGMSLYSVVVAPRRYMQLARCSVCGSGSNSAPA